jgi:sterol 3beta-glucosyltransferase
MLDARYALSAGGALISGNLQKAMMGRQPFWARRLEKLGLSISTVPQRKLDADRLAAAVKAAVADDAPRTAAQRMARRIAGEDGGARVLGTVESLLGRA